ncbi:immunoglobulin-like domain-containing protein [Velocimicrobium porci]|uniref:Bacterial Ig-like domain-containing protein n=1 Tax=Velocimicrobium porci TaxID=2606634 RepID=A0A6L5Y150_9FIRM|nr:immunoglobulin-like domain-containing protein [Velocimicrobium porci]MSS63883.1 hypothetical protein [Velocimicrobium porci]
MRKKITAMKKILFGVVVGAACFSMTGCIEVQKSEAIEKVSAKSIEKNVDAIFCKKLTDKDADKKVKKTIKLNVKKDLYTGKDKKLIYTIKNTTGRNQQVVLAPRLERKTKNGYEDVPCITGFCGTADPLEEQLEGSILLEWYPNLSKGTYRLSFRAIKQTEQTVKEITLKDTFEYEP